MFSKAVAYVLGILSFVPPFNGLLRFYLKRYPSGIVFSLTAGCCWIGNILDIVQIPQLVKDANRRLKQREMMLLDDAYDEYDEPVRGERESLEFRKQEESIEKHILRSAKSNRGYTTPSEVALSSEVSVEQAKQALDYLVSKGNAEMKINKLGTIVYFFPDILDSENVEEFDDL
jgi:hypothetical protein